MYILLLLSILYTIGSLVRLKADNFFCPLYSEEEVRQFNYENGNEQGLIDSCYYIDRTRVNWKAVQTLDIEIFDAIFEFTDIFVALQFSLYLVISCILLSYCIFHTYILIYDTIYACIEHIHQSKNSNTYTENETSKHGNNDVNNINDDNNNNITIDLDNYGNPRVKATLRRILRRLHDEDPHYETKQDGDTNTKQRRRSCLIKWQICIIKCFNGRIPFISDYYYKYIAPYYYTDSKWYLLSMGIRELFEIAVQIYGLFLYGGVNIFDPGLNVLSQEPYVVRDLAIIISINCVFAGVLFVLYVIKRDIIHGRVFISLFFAIDTIFEIIYICFPLLYLTSGNSVFDLVSLGVLREQNFFIFVQSLWITILLTNKCHRLSMELNPSQIVLNYWNTALKSLNMNNNNGNHTKNKQQPWIDCHKQQIVKPVASTSYPASGRTGTNKLTKKQVLKTDTEGLRSRSPSVSDNNVNHDVSDNIADLYDNNDNNDNDDNVETAAIEIVENQTTAAEADVCTLGDVSSFTKSRIQVTNVMSIAELADKQILYNLIVNQTKNTQTIQLVKEINGLFLCKAIANTGTTPNIKTTVNISGNSSLDNSYSNQQDVNLQVYARKQDCRKAIVVSYGFFLIIVGIVILSTFLSFINNDFNNKCINVNDDSNGDYLFKNPELSVYNEYCEKQVINIFNHDYPCNCRLFVFPKITDLNFDSDSDAGSERSRSILNQTILELSMNKYTNLQGMAIGGSLYDQGSYNLTRKMFSNLKHLKILFLEHMDVYNIDESISQLENLEIFRLGYSDTVFYVPFESLGNIESLKAIHILNRNTILNTFISENICQLINVRYFVVTNGYGIGNVPFDCIVTNWLDLEYLELRLFTQLSYVPPQLWSMPNLNTVLFDWCDLNQSVLNFDTFDGYSNSLTTVSIYGNDQVCHSMYTYEYYDDMYTVDGNYNATYTGFDVDFVLIGNISYQGFAYLYDDNSSIISGFDNSFALTSFISKFDPCKQSCDDVGSVGVCSRFEWKDGVCDIPCNTQACNWDGGDCIQTCAAFIDTSDSDDDDDNINECNVDMLFNSKCDTACNVTQCDYDLHECALFETNGTCNGIVIGNNSSINIDDDNSTGTCYNEWADDLWCDKNCNITQCGFDNGVCNDCIDECRNIYSIWIVTSNVYQPNEILTLPELCDNWAIIQAVGDQIMGHETNCTLLFDAGDINNNGLMGFREGIILTASAYGLDTSYKSDEKLQQVDCSHCMVNRTLYSL